MSEETETPKPGTSSEPAAPIPATAPVAPEAQPTVPEAPAAAPPAVAPAATVAATPAGAAAPAAAAPAAAAPAPPAAKPAAPAAKPAAKAAAEPAADAMPRRKFILGMAWGAFTAAMASCGVAMTRFMYPNVLVEPPSVVKIGYPEDYATGEVDERWKERYAIWVVRDDHGIFVLSTVCTHLGCPPNWLKTEEKFKCPCHGSGFYRTGINFEGPAPRPLERFAVSRGPDGQIVVNKNRKFQQEKGQWEDPEAYLRLA
jgi:cytochrome b6-f complex iron-sulfur subunit